MMLLLTINPKRGEPMPATSFRRTLRFLLSVLFVVKRSSAAAAESDAAGYERVLLPITVRNAPGAFGSIWNTNFFITVKRDDSKFKIAPFEPRAGCDVPCPIFQLQPIPARVPVPS